MGPRYVISVTKNEAKNEAGFYQNRIASHFNLAPACGRAVPSCHLTILKIACIYWLGAKPSEIA